MAQPQIPLIDRLRQYPDAYAKITGGPGHAGLQGAVYFYRMDAGTLVLAQVEGLPHPPDPCAAQVFGFHIHEGSACTGTAADPFADAGAHYNPHGCPHPAHAGDMPPLFGNGGYAFQMFYTGRFTPEEIVGRTVVVHADPDDFTTQPAGDSGMKIACGIIVRVAQ